MHWLSTAHPFHPAPGELRDLALQLVTRGEKSPDEAWMEVKDAMRQIGYYGKPEWSSDRIARTVTAFGWRDLCLIESDQIGIIRAQFMRIYEAQAKRENDDRLMLPETRQTVDRLIGETTKRLSAARR